MNIFRRESLPKLPSSALILENAQATVRTAEGIIILKLSTSTMRALITAASQRSALHLRAEPRAITIIPSRKEKPSVLDPKDGWIIALSPGHMDALAAMAPEEGEHDLGKLAIVIEEGTKNPGSG